MPDFGITCLYAGDLIGRWSSAVLMDAFQEYTKVSKCWRTDMMIDLRRLNTWKFHLPIIRDVCARNINIHKCLFNHEISQACRIWTSDIEAGWKGREVVSGVWDTAWVKFKLLCFSILHSESVEDFHSLTTYLLPLTYNYEPHIS